MKTLKVLIILGLFSPVSTWAQASVDGLTEEEKEIMQVITEQTRSYFERDFESWKNTMSNTEHYREHTFWEGWDDKVRVTEGWETRLKASQKRFDPNLPKSKWNEAKYLKSDINIQVSEAKDMAWATYQQKAINPDTKVIVGASLETRVLEKEKGDWKIIYIGYHYFPKEKTEETH